MGKNTDISARISLMLDSLGVKPNPFAKNLKYDRAQTIYDILSGKNAPSYDFFYRFMMSEYSAIIDIDWLITGRGDMIRKIIEAEANNINQDCKLCSEKDKRIEALERTIKTQSDFIDSLKGLNSSSKDGQKRKAG